jgi:hypothetical protein
MEETTPLEETKPKPRLFAPNVLPLLGFCFLPIGSLLASMNWSALGDRKRAAVSGYFFLVSSAIFAILALANTAPPSSASTAGLVLFAFWSLFSAYPQQKHVQEQLADKYESRSLAPAWVVVLGLYGASAYSFFGGTPSPETAASQVKAMFEASWKKSPPLDTVKILDVKLKTTTSDHYAGTVKVEQSGTILDLEVAAEYKRAGGELHANFPHAAQDLVALQLLPSMVAVYKKRTPEGQVLITKIALQSKDEHHLEGKFTLDRGGKSAEHRILVDSSSGQLNWKVPE